MAPGYRSYRREVMRDLRAELARRNRAVALLMQNGQRRKIVEMGVVDTGRTLNSTTHTSDEEVARAGTNVDYAIYPVIGANDTEPRNWPVEGVLEEVPNIRRIYSAPMRTGGGR